jgi:hypothetical protein
LRESFARTEDRLAPAQDIVVVARPAARELAEREGLQGIDAALTELLDRARLRAGTRTPDGGDAIGEGSGGAARGSVGPADLSPAAADPRSGSAARDGAQDTTSSEAGSSGAEAARRLS